MARIEEIEIGDGRNLQNQMTIEDTTGEGRINTTTGLCKEIIIVTISTTIINVISIKEVIAIFTTMTTEDEETLIIAIVIKMIEIVTIDRKTGKNLI